MDIHYSTRKGSAPNQTGRLLAEKVLMKKYFMAILIVAFGLFSKASFAQELQSTQIMELDIPLNPPVMAGSKVIYTAKEGAISGSITGKVLPLGGDFGTIMNATTFKLDVRLVIQTKDSATVYITYSGYLYTDAETFSLIASGKGADVNPSKYYFRTNPVFETTAAKYDWLNHTVAVGTGTLTKTGVNYKIYAIK
jgi:hypothetical protein